MSKDQSTIVIASAARTPVGSFNGALASLPAHDLGKIAIKAALERARVEAGEVSEVIMGQILGAGAGQNPARQASIGAGIPVDAPAWGMNQLCGSGLRAVALGAQQIELGSSKVVVAGGMESMSQAPHCAHLRDGTKMGDMKFIDTMIKDGLWDAFNGYHMGDTTKNVGAPMADHAQGRAASRWPPRTRPRPPRRPAGSRTRSRPSPSSRARARRSSPKTSTSRTASPTTR